MIIKTPLSGTNWFFVDESGDPTFYDTTGNYIVGAKGCSSILLLGFIETNNPIEIRQKVEGLRGDLISDPYFQEFPSIKKTALAFHATDDLPEIRYQVFKMISNLDFKAQFIVARKIEKVFLSKFQSKESLFYDYLVSKLFENTLHRYEQNFVYFAKRGSRDRQAPLSEAIHKGLSKFEEKWKQKVDSNLDIQAQTPKGEPCLSVIDYMNWAVYRAFTKGEMRYFNTVAEKVSLLVDLYDTSKYPKSYYSKQNPFDIKKITPL